MKPNPDKAKAILEQSLANWQDDNVRKADLMFAAARALAFLRCYELPPERWEQYRCSFCGVHGVKLWRAAYRDGAAWCSKCGTEQAGLSDTIDADGRIEGRHGKSDQIYSPDKGLCLLPFVPAPDGGTWGYTSVPQEGCEWWRGIPTRCVPYVCEVKELHTKGGD